MRALLFLTLTMVAGAAIAADVYVCKGANGVTAFQQEPCPKTSRYLAHSTYTAHLNDEDQPGSDALQPPTHATPRPPVVHTSGGVPMAQYTPPPMRGGIGSSAYQRGAVQATQCTAPNGKVYYTTRECQQRSVQVGTEESDWHRDHVEGVPGAVMIGPDLALDPATGATIHLQHADHTVPVFAQQTDPGTRVDPDQACAAAKAYSQSHYSDDRAAARARDVCRTGRSLWDMHSGGGIPQRGGGN